MGESLSPDRMFNFFEDGLELHPAYDFFAPGPLLGYAGNPSNNNGWLEADDYLLGELKAMVDEPMVIPAIEEVPETVAAAEQEQVVTLVVDIEEEQMETLLMDMEEDFAALFGEDDDFEDDDFSDNDSERPPSIYEVAGPSNVAAERLSFPLPAPRLPIPPSVIEDLSTHLGNLKYGHGQLVKKVIQVSDAEVATGVSIEEIGLTVFAIEGQVQVMASQMVHVADRLEHVGAQVEQGQPTATQRDETIAELTQQVHVLQAAVQQRDDQTQQVQTMVSETSSRESTLMQCILRLDMRLAELERRPLL
nr:hypothetical protein [Tanacetum cinerariifolium]